MRKKLLLPFITFTGMSVACMAFELSNILSGSSLNGTSTVIALKEKYSFVNTEGIAIMLGCFLYLTTAYSK